MGFRKFMDVRNSPVNSWSSSILLKGDYYGEKMEIKLESPAR